MKSEEKFNKEIMLDGNKSIIEKEIDSNQLSTKIQTNIDSKKNNDALIDINFNDKNIERRISTDNAINQKIKENFTAEDIQTEFEEKNKEDEELKNEKKIVKKKSFSEEFMIKPEGNPNDIREFHFSMKENIIVENLEEKFMF